MQPDSSLLTPALVDAPALSHPLGSALIHGLRTAFEPMGDKQKGKEEKR